MGRPPRPMAPAADMLAGLIARLIPGRQFVLLYQGDDGPADMVISNIKDPLAAARILERAAKEMHGGTVEWEQRG
jgi:hypothetical protein